MSSAAPAHGPPAAFGLDDGAPPDGSLVGLAALGLLAGRAAAGATKQLASRARRRIEGADTGSADTIDYHLRKVFRKVGVTSRRPLTRDPEAPAQEAPAQEVTGSACARSCCRPRPSPR